LSNNSRSEDLSSDSSEKMEKFLILNHLQRINKRKRKESRLEKEKIILADNNLIEIQSTKFTLMKYMLENSLNFEIILCYDGVEILRNLLNERVKNGLRYIFTEDKMENLDGVDIFKIVKIMRKRKYLKNVQLILLGTIANDEHYKIVYESGADFIKNKPLSHECIKEIIKIE
jgi:hypothetical protein